MTDEPNTSTTPGSTEVRHPLFARFFYRLSQLMERDIGARRDELLAGLSGRVLEVGAGNGMNFGHYPRAVETVVALEPEPYLRSKAVEAAAAAPVPVELVDAVADPLPMGTDSFDAAVSSLVLCTVPDPAGALAEMRRLLKPRGELRLMEHVRSQDRRKARVQAWADSSGIWPRLAGGCHCARDTASAVEAAGFEIAELRDFDLGPSWGLTNPHILGRARPA